MGGKSTKSSLRNAIVFLNISADPVSINDDKFWSQIFSEDLSLADEIIKNITVQEIRMLRDGSPKNFASLAYKMVERLNLATGTLCNTQSQQTAVLNSIRILIRMLPCCFEDKEWRHFFENNFISQGNELRNDPNLLFPEKAENDRDYTSYVPQGGSSATTTPTELNRAATSSSKKSRDEDNLLMSEQSATSSSAKSDRAKNSPQGPYALERKTNLNDKSMMQALIISICDLLFCPEFTVLPHGVGYLGNAVDTPPEDLKSLSTYDYVWEPGVGFESNVNSTTYYDKNRSELLCALLVCLSGTLYETPESSIRLRNRWIETLVTQGNRHALPLFTSLLNVSLGHKPSRTLLKINQYLFENSRERLVGLSAQLLNAVLDYQMDDLELPSEESNIEAKDCKKNLFVEYMSRIHRKEDFDFMMKGFVRLMNDGLGQGYIWGSTKCLDLDQELQLLFWRICNLNRKFTQHILTSNEVQDLVVPTLYHLNENFRETSKTALIHICVFNLLNLSSERNFGVRLNKPYTSSVLGNLPDFTGSHADLMIIVFHKLIMYGYKINQLYDYMLTILVNVSPYLKGATILASKCLIQLFETFSSPLVIFTEPCYHQLVIFLLEIFNNIIQYQFDGNSNLIYIILSKKGLFKSLASLSTSQASIDKILKKLIKQKERAEEFDVVDTKQEQKEGVISKDGQSSQSECQHPNIEDFNHDLATVSSSNSVSDSDNKSRKQEVSLVATPDLYHVTLPVYPFGKEETQRDIEQDDKTPCENRTIFNFDDIMTESNLCELTDYKSELAAIDSELTEKAENRTSIEPESCIVIHEKTPEPDGVPDASVMNISNNGRSDDWRPTSDWLKKWKQSLPLQTILRMIAALDPQIELLRHSSGRAVDEVEIIKFLQNGTLVGLLPVPHPIQIRKYRTDSSSKMWFRACSWGIIYVRGTIWTGTNVRLIKMK